MLSVDVARYLDKVNSAIKTKKIRLRFLELYTGLMQLIFKSIISLFRHPSRIFDVVIAAYWLPKVEVIFRLLFKVLKKLCKLIAPTT